MTISAYLFRTCLIMMSLLLTFNIYVPTYADENTSSSDSTAAIDQTIDEPLTTLSSVDYSSFQHKFQINSTSAMSTITQTTWDGKFIIDIQNSDLGDLDNTVPIDENIYVNQVRASQFSVDPDITRIVFDLKDDVTPSSVSLSDDRKSITVIFGNDDLEGIVITKDESYDTIHIGGDFSGINVFRLADPERLVIDLSNAIYQDGYSEDLDFSGTYISSYRISQFNDTTTRIVLETTGTPDYHVIEDNDKETSIIIGPYDESTTEKDETDENDETAVDNSDDESGLDSDSATTTTSDSDTKVSQDNGDSDDNVNSDTEEVSSDSLDDTEDTSDADTSDDDSSANLSDADDLDYKTLATIQGSTISQSAYTISYNYAEKQATIDFTDDIFSKAPVTDVKDSTALTNIEISDHELQLTSDHIYEYRLVFLDGRFSIQAIRPKDRYDHIIVIDPGHGGMDPGANNDTVQEKELTLSIGQHLKTYIDADEDELSDDNMHFYFTRLDDSYPTLAQRCEIANDLGADLYISLHINSMDLEANSSKASINGLEIYLTDDMDHSDQEAVFASDLLNMYSSNIQGLTIKDARVHNTYYVLNGTDTASVLIEFGYLTNTSDLDFLMNDDNRDALASDLFDTILDYFGD